MNILHFNRTSRAGRHAGFPLALFALAWLTLWSCGETPDALGPAATTALDASAAPALDASVAPALDAAAPAFQPDATSPFAAALFADIDFSPKRVLSFLVPPVLTDRSASKLIPAATGGFVELNGFRVDIPAGALAEDTVITLDLPTTLPAALFVVADFGPQGLTFSKPVKLTFSLTGVDLVDIDLDTVKIWFWDGSKWRNPSGGIKGGNVVRRTKHFSTYGARGIDTTSGG